MTKSQTISKQILVDLREGRFGEEGRLPPELQLARHYKASRSTIRESLSLLSHHNLIKRKQKRGTRAVVPPAHQTRRVLLALYDVQGVRTGDDYYYRHLLKGIREELGKDFDLELAFKDDLVNLAKRPAWSNIAGVIFPFAHSRESTLLQRLAEADLPVIAVNAPPPMAAIDSVCYDNLSAGILATRHLADEGCRRIAFVGLPEYRLSAYERFKGYRSVVIQRDLDADPALHIVVDDYGEKQGYEAGRQILRMARRPDGICAVSDFLLVGLMRALLEAGMRIPQDIRCVGYGDYPIAQFYHPALSSIRADPVLCGKRAAVLLRQRMQQEAEADIPIQRIEIPVELVQRESSGIAGSINPIEATGGIHASHD